MTLPIVFVLYSALVCSSVGVVSEQMADNNNKFKNMRRITLQGLLKEDIFTDNMRTETRSNTFRYSVNAIDNLTYAINSYGSRQSDVDKVRKYTETHAENYNPLNRHLNIYSQYKFNNSLSSVKGFIRKKRVRRSYNTNDCDSFSYKKGKSFISHPHIGDNDNVNYPSKTYCTTVIRGSENQVVQLTFVDMFHIEEHPECGYDFLEIRDGDQGYYNLLGKVCGENFPPQITTTGPNAWLKFYSDDNIEYQGFRIQIDFIQKDSSVSVPKSCVTEMSGKYGRISSDNLNEDCTGGSANQALDYLWRIDVPEGHKIYLNFTTYTVGEPNECDKNFVQVFGSVLEYDEKLAHYCGSVAMPVATIGSSAKDGEANENTDQGNVMHVRMYAAREQRAKTFVDATFTAYRTLDLSKNNTCDTQTEFDCEDNTCIDIALRCNNYANCRLKADEEKDLCKHTTESLIQQPRIQMIVSVFCVILSGITFVFFFKCIKKLYNDHTAIKEQINQSCEDKLDSMIGSRLVLDPRKLQRDCEPRASLERDNQTNEMFKEQRRLQQRIRPTSIDSDFIPEIDEKIDEEIWLSKVKDVAKTEHVRTEGNKRTKIKEELETDDIIIENNEKLRKGTKNEKQEIEEIKIDQNDRTKRNVGHSNKAQRNDIIKIDSWCEELRDSRDMSVSFPDTKQSGCQTRDSLFLTDPIMKANGSSAANVRGLSMFRHSTSIARPSPQINPSEIIIEVIRPIPEQEEKTQKKDPDPRPMSTETTRSAPDVIILAKP